LSKAPSDAANATSGLVVSGFGRHYVVESANGVRTTCHPRGKKSMCVVGDRVRWQASGDEGVIEQLKTNGRPKRSQPTSTRCW
jgi:ribosome biogenesis GTPase / thiamine phosphate phosphatase